MQVIAVTAKPGLPGYTIRFESGSNQSGPDPGFGFFQSSCLCQSIHYAIVMIPIRDETKLEFHGMEVLERFIQQSTMAASIQKNSQKDSPPYSTGNRKILY